MPQIMSPLTQPSSGSPKWRLILPAFALLYFAVLLVQNWLPRFAASPSFLLFLGSVLVAQALIVFLAGVCRLSLVCSKVRGQNNAHLFS